MSWKQFYHAFILVNEHDSETTKCTQLVLFSKICKYFVTTQFTTLAPTSETGNNTFVI